MKLMRGMLLGIVTLMVLVCMMSACGGTEEKPCEHGNMIETDVFPDCSKEGYLLHTCADCGYSFKSDYLEPLGHKLESAVTAPTCTEEGFTTYTCSRCGYQFLSDTTPPTGHYFTSRITLQNCTEEGYTTYTCACGYSYITDHIVPNGHNLEATMITPTCTEAGYTLYSCRNCSYSFKTDFTSPAHRLTSRTVAATCTEPGYTAYTCSACGLTYKTDLTAPKGHSFTQIDTKRPGIGTMGYTVYTCSACFYSYMTDYVWHSNIFSKAANETNVLSKGVDLSYYDGTVDFTALKRGGINFVILRAGYQGTKDTKFEQYYSAAKAAGLDVGCYFYSYAKNTDMLDIEINDLLTYIEGKTFEYPIYLDMEDTTLYGLTKEMTMRIIDSYCAKMLDNGWFPGIYSYRNWIDGHMNEEEFFTLYDTWVAYYPENVNTLGLDYYIDTASVWQYSEDATVNGVNVPCDINVCYKNYPEIIKKYHFNGFH